MLLATHPEIQEKAFAELNEVFYSDEVEISYDNITKLDYLERIIKESLRLCPVVPGEFEFKDSMDKLTELVYFQVIGRETQAPVQVGKFVKSLNYVHQ
jgi:cytochrome P450